MIRRSKLFRRGARGGGGVPFSPQNMTNNIFTMLATTRVEVSGLVSEWTDLSGASNECTQGTGSNRPRVSTDGDNKPGMGFVGGRWFVNAASAVIQTGSHTFSCWAKFNAITSGNHGFFGSWQGGGQLWAKAEYSHTNNRIEWHFSSTGANDAFGHFAWTDKLDWHHFLFLYNAAGSTNADKCKIYVDGVSQTLTFSGTIPASLFAAANNFAVGASVAAGTASFLGRMDQVQYLSRTVSTSEIAQLYAYRPRSKGAVYKTAEFGITAAPAYYVIPDNAALSAGVSNTELSIAFRAYADVMGSADRGIISKIWGGSHEYSITYSNVGNLLVAIGDPFLASFASWNSVFTPEIWKNIVVVFDGALAAGSRVKVYLDGVDLGAPNSQTGTWPTSIANQTTDLWIGQLNGGDATTDWDGRIADIQIYQRALTSTEALGLFNFTQPSPGPSVWYNMNQDNDGDGSSADGDSGGVTNQVVDAIAAVNGTITGDAASWLLRNFP